MCWLSWRFRYFVAYFIVFWYRKPALTAAFRGVYSAISLQTIAQRDDSGQMVFDGLHELTGPGAREGALRYDLAGRYSVFPVLAVPILAATVLMYLKVF